MKFRKSKKSRVCILISIIIILNFFTTIKSCYAKSNSMGELAGSINAGGFITDKVTANVAFYANKTVRAPRIPTSLKVISYSYNSAYISWGGVTGASVYEVYRATSSAGKYTLMSTTTSTSYTNTGLNTGTTYYYKVRAYTKVGTGKVYSNYSGIVSAKPIPSVPISVTAVLASYNSIKTTWRAVVGASGYEVYRSISSGGTYTFMSTVASTNYNDNCVKAGTTYYYKVRSYTTVGKTKVYSNYSASVIVTASNKGYVNNLETKTDLNVRSTPSIKGTIIGHLYNFQKVEILDTKVDTSNNVWDKIAYNGKFAYVSNAYIQLYSCVSDKVVNMAVNITKQFEVGVSNQIAGNFDGEGLSLGYLQWCIGQKTLQPLLNRMDRQYNSEMKGIFGVNYNKIHTMILDSTVNQLKWAKSINDSTNKIINPWYAQFVSLSKNQHFINIEHDSEAYLVRKAMIICNNYNLKTARGFALAFDIVVQNGSISSGAAKIIDNVLMQRPNMNEKTLLGVIANAVEDSSANNSKDIRSRKIAIVNGRGIVHGSMLYLDTNYGLNDSYWR